MTENRESDEALKLERLRVAAKVGTNALDRGDFKEFPNAADLVAVMQASPSQEIEIEAPRFSMPVRAPSTD